ncbi:NmrA family protein [Leptotrichia sp. oral taxon 215 str. W9775]|uniref:SDR family oxidoreductase n=1 Tax=Leptotrichia sp. oral taxon 215 TaxID=712359 RepID=UPI0003AE52EF|nr:SDR family oxidoreductase [Leptotrichia sp. oral taxon 215]ERK68974.1 NmrA family protein [Leptotrichia sp. oral taxon 215 str. W9775]
MPKIAVTGVTGNLGGIVSGLCKKNGIEVRNLARNVEKAEKLGFSNVFKSSYDKSEDTVKSLKGIEVLFMVSGSENPNRVQQHKDFIDAAKIAGVSHIIYLSFYNASKNSIFTLGRDHYATEEYIKENGFKYTFLRDNFYADFFVDLCREYGEIKGPAGNGKVSAVVRSDVSEVVAKILENPGKWENQTLNMTGPEELSMTEIVKAVSEYFGKEIKYIEETVEEAYKSRKIWKAEQWEYNSWVSTYIAIAENEQSGISNDIEKVLGRKATSLVEYLEK